MNIITTILTNLDSQIKNLVSEYANYNKQQTGKDMTEYELMITEIMITYDFVKSVEKYTSNTDNLVSVSSQVSAKGNLEINAVIERNNIKYNLFTEVIYAGGYNIQKLHYRYITHSNLPKTNNFTISDQYADKIKKVNKIQKLQEELTNAQNHLTKYQDNMTDKSIKTELKFIDKIKMQISKIAL